MYYAFMQPTQGYSAIITYIGCPTGRQNTKYCIPLCFGLKLGLQITKLSGGWGV